MKVLSHHVARSKFGAESETESIDNVGADEGHGGGTCLEHLWASQPFSLIKWKLYTCKWETKKKKKSHFVKTHRQRKCQLGMVIENSASQTQGWDASLDQICYCDRCATVEKRVRKRGATLCKTPLIHKGLAAKEVGHVGWRSPTPKLLHRSFLKLRLDQNNWETLLPMSAACGQHLGCKTCMISIQLQRIWKEYTDVILLGVCGDWAFAIMLFPVLFFFFFFSGKC